MDFFNELGKKFTQAARSVQERTRESAESTRLASDLRSAQADLERQLAELGRAYYESTVAGTGEVPAGLIDQVRRTMDLIDTLSAQRERSRQQVRCPGCGAVQAEDARFCSSCGRPMPEKDPDPDEDPADCEAEYCAECGAMRHGRAKYCAVCGHAFLTGDSLPAPKPPEPAAQPLEESEEPDLYEE